MDTKSSREQRAMGRTQFLICCLWVTLIPTYAAPRNDLSKAYLNQLVAVDGRTDESRSRCSPYCPMLNELIVKIQFNNRQDVQEPCNHGFIHKNFSSVTHDLSKSERDIAPEQVQDPEPEPEPEPELAQEQEQGEAQIQVQQQEHIQEQIQEQIQKPIQEPEPEYDFLWVFGYQNRFDLPNPRYIQAKTELRETTEPMPYPELAQTLRNNWTPPSVPPQLSGKHQSLSANSNTELSMLIPKDPEGCADFCP